MAKSPFSIFLYTLYTICASLSILITICIGCCIAINFVIGNIQHTEHNLYEIHNNNNNNNIQQKNTIFKTVLRKDIQLDTSSCANITSYEQFITTIECFEGNDNNKKYCNLNMIECADNFLTISTSIHVYISHSHAIKSLTNKKNKCKINFNLNFLNVKINQMCYSMDQTVYTNYLW
jgi:hypothetical protein